MRESYQQYVARHPRTFRAGQHGGRDRDTEMLRVLGAAVRCGQRDVIDAIISRPGDIPRPSPEQSARLLLAIARQRRAEKQQQPVATYAATGTVHMNCACSPACAQAWSARLTEDTNRALAARGMTLEAAQLTNVTFPHEDNQ